MYHCISVYAFTWIYVNLCEFIWMYEIFIWMCMNLHVHEHDFISNYLIYSEFIRVYMNMLWIYLKICSLPDCRTLTHRWTAAHCHAHCRMTAAHTAAHTTVHTAALLDIAVCSAANCSTLHEFECRIAAHRTPHTAHSTQSHTVIITWFKSVACECICIYMNLREFMWINMNPSK
jgi:hypothetical protein